MSRTMTRKEPVLRSMEPGLRHGDPAQRPGEPPLKEVTLTTTPNLEARTIAAYLGIVGGETILGADIVRERSAGFLARFRGRSTSVDSSLAEAREAALRDLKSRAAARGADAVVGVSLAQDVVNDRLIISATGTAVRLSQ